MLSDFQIKQFELSDRDALLSFLRLAYPGEPRKGDPAFWNWQFLENPYTEPDNIPIWLVKRATQILGQTAAIPVELKVGKEQKRALWIVDYILHPNYRGKKLGKRLLQMPHRTHSKILLTLGYNQKAEKPMRSLSWELLGSVSRYQIQLFPGDAVTDIARLGPIRKLVNLSYGPFRPSARTLAPTASGTVRQITNFDPSFDDLWTEASVQWPCAVVRSSRLLEWQFIRQPGKKYDALAYSENGHLLGYIVLFFRKAGPGGVSSKAAISDLCYRPTRALETIDELLKAALRLAIERRAGSIVTDILDTTVEERLRRFGFWRLKAGPPFAANVLENGELINRLKNWFLTRGDCDVSIFEEPNL